MYIFKHDSIDFQSLIFIPEPVDLHFWLGISQKLAENQGFSSKWAARCLLYRFESVVIYYNDGIYISKHDSTDLDSLTPLAGSVDLHFWLEISQQLAENQGFSSKIDRPRLMI